MYEFAAPDKRRPVVILSRQAVIPLLRTVMVAPITSTVHGVPSEVVVGPEHGLKRSSAINLDHVQTVDKARLRSFVAHLPRRHGAGLQRCGRNGLHGLTRPSRGSVGTGLVGRQLLGSVVLQRSRPKWTRNSWWCVQKGLPTTFCGRQPEQQRPSRCGPASAGADEGDLAAHRLAVGDDREHLGAPGTAAARSDAVEGAQVASSCGA
jgi:mRNA interferase MazF